MSGSLMVWACRRCKVTCHEVVGPLGEKTWVHGRVWEKHDHEPVPFKTTAAALTLSCDYCGDVGARWVHDGRNVEVQFLGPGRPSYPYGPRWSACDTCDRLALAGDVEGLVRQHFSSSAAAAYGPNPAAALVSMQRQVYAKYVPSITRRRLIPPPPPPPPDLTPARLPRVRDKLVDNVWGQAGGLYRKVIANPPKDDPILLPTADFSGEEAFGDEFLGGLAALMRGVDPRQASVRTVGPPKEAVDRFCERMATGLRVGELYWVSSEFTMLAVQAGKKLPDLTITEDQMPSTSGLIVYSQPITEVDLDSAEGKVEVVAASWVRIPRGLWLTLYCRPENTAMAGEIGREWLHANIGYLVPIAPGAGMHFGTHEADGIVGEGVGAWGTLLSTWFLMDQPGVATVTEQEPDRKARQRASRAGRAAPRVRLIDLRRQKTRVAEQQSEAGRTFHYSVRFLVGGDTGGFWRDQAHGPQRSLRKRIWIEPFMKGPDGAPLKADKAPIVRVLK